MEILPRLIESVLDAALESVPVVVLEGGRATGTSTVIAADPGLAAWAGRVWAAPPTAALVGSLADTVGLRAFAAETGEACVRGIVVYEGDRVIDLTPPLGPELVAVPRALI